MWHQDSLSIKLLVVSSLIIIPTTAFAKHIRANLAHNCGDLKAVNKTVSRLLKPLHPNNDAEVSNEDFE
jgi:hypothetical protein